MNDHGMAQKVSLRGTSLGKVAYGRPAAAHSYQPLLSMALMFSKGETKADITWHQLHRISFLQLNELEQRKRKYLAQQHNTAWSWNRTFYFMIVRPTHLPLTMHLRTGNCHSSCFKLKPHDCEP